MTSGVTRTPVLIVGGYGAFGARAAQRLARLQDVDLIIAGRDLARADAAANALAGRVVTPAVRAISATGLDAAKATAADLRRIGCSIVLNASGPFQNAAPNLARACVDAGCHYVDLADDRAFVVAIGTLDAAAKQAGVLVVSGASTVPAVSAAVIDHYRGEFDRLQSVTYGVSPGNNFDPGLATVQSILSYVGKPFAMRLDGRQQTVHGWQGLRRQRFGTLGRRWLGACDIPDLSLFTARYPEIETLCFGAGVEVPMFHFGMWALSWLVRVGMIRHAEALAKPLMAAKRALGFLGSDAGGMAIQFDGIDRNGRLKRLSWSLVARSGDGPTIPPTPAVIVIRKLLDGSLLQRGAMPCLGLVTLAELEHELADLDIAFEVS